MTPVENFNGSATITVTANDGTENSSPASFTLTVSPVNDAPVLASIADQTTAEDTPLAVTLSATDVDGDSLTYSAVSSTEDIIVSVSGSVLTLTPASNFNGTGIINVTASDSTVSSNTVTFPLTVIPVNDAPVLTPIDDQTVQEDQSLTLSLSSTDNDGDNVSYSAESATESVTVFVIGSLLNLIPNENFNGSATITVTASDGTESSHPASFTLTVNPVNDAPVLGVISNQITPEDTPLTVTLSATDVDGDSLTYSAVSSTENITVSVSGSDLTLTPELNFYGNGIIIISADDGTVESNTVTFNLTVTQVNDAPVLADITDQVILEDQTASISLSAIDVDGDNLTYSVESDTASVTVILNGNIMTFILEENFNGTAVITATASDGTESSNMVTFILTVTAVNDAPGDFTLLLPENNATVYITDDTDLNAGLTFTWEESGNVDGDTITYSWSGTGSFDPLNSLEISVETIEITIPYAEIRQVMQDSSVQTLTGTWTVTATDGEFDVPAQFIFLLTIDATALSVLAESALPEAFALYQNYPNPFNPVTTITYGLPYHSHIQIIIFDMLGKEITQLVNTNQQAGFKSVQWDATDSMGRPVSAGVYLYQIEAGEFVQTKKMVLLK
jgi:hypothetical protein